MATFERYLSLPPEPVSVVEARQFVRRTLAEWRCDELRDAAGQIVTELATNAVLHAGTPFTVIVTMARVVRIEVHDRSPIVPELKSVSTSATTGRGLMVVQALAQSWGVARAPDGKCVWAELTPVGDRAESARRGIPRRRSPLTGASSATAGSADSSAAEHDGAVEAAAVPGGAGRQTRGA